MIYLIKTTQLRRNLTLLFSKLKNMKNDSSAPNKLCSIKEEWKLIATSELRLLAEKESKRLIWKIDVNLITNQLIEVNSWCRKKSMIV